MSKKIAVCIGTRPEAIKMAPVVHALQATPGVEPVVFVTGQHKDMVDPILNFFNIKPEVKFSLEGRSKELSHVCAALLENVDFFLEREKPDILLAQGDTVSVLAAGLAAHFRNIPFGHVEAGLRTYNISSPWPEEGNRRVVSPIARYHFAPTQQSKIHLLQEKIDESQIHVTGNTVIDALMYTVKSLESNKIDLIELDENVKKIAGERIVLITGHRRENLNGGLESVCRAVKKLAEIFSDVQFVFPVHLNPIVQRQVSEILGNNLHKNIWLIPPQQYFEFVWLMKQSYFIITDSGGIQEEAPSLGKPVLVTRDTTERPEGVGAGCVKLVGTIEDNIVNVCSALLTDVNLYNIMSQASNPYGDGEASKRIANICALD